MNLTLDYATKRLRTTDFLKTKTVTGVQQPMTVLVLFAATTPFLSNKKATGNKQPWLSLSTA